MPAVETVSAIDCHLLRLSTLDGREKSCPFCQKDDFKLIENSDLKKSINNLKVYCLCCESGCMYMARKAEERKSPPSQMYILSN